MNAQEIKRCCRGKNYEEFIWPKLITQSMQDEAKGTPSVTRE